MTNKEIIRAKIEKIMADEMSFFKESCDAGEGGVSSAAIYTMMQLLLQFVDSLPEEPVKKIWHDASETPSIFGTYLLVHDGGWCVARYFGKNMLPGNITGWVEISENIFVEHPQQWLDLRDLLPPKNDKEK